VNINGTWFSACTPSQSNAHIGGRDPRCAEIGACPAAGTFGKFLRAVSSDCMSKHFDDVSTRMVVVWNVEYALPSSTHTLQLAVSSIDFLLTAAPRSRLSALFRCLCFDMQLLCSIVHLCMYTIMALRSSRVVCT